MSDIYIKPCPLCGAEMLFDRVMFQHPDETEEQQACPLADLNWSTEHYGELWNTRAGPQS